MTATCLVDKTTAPTNTIYILSCGAMSNPEGGAVMGDASVINRRGHAGTITKSGPVLYKT